MKSVWTLSHTLECNMLVKLSTPEPNPPVNVTITQTTCNSITVHWTPPADNGNAAVTQYRVLVYKDSGPRVVATNVPTMKLSYQVTSLDPKTDYTVEVQAGNDGEFGNGSSANSTTKPKGYPLNKLLHYMINAMHSDIESAAWPCMFSDNMLCS